MHCAIVHGSPMGCNRTGGLTDGERARPHPRGSRASSRALAGIVIFATVRERIGLPAIKIGRCLRFRESDIERILSGESQRPALALHLPTAAEEGSA